jgi:hypothetical protein
MSARQHRRPFRACQPPQVVRDNTLGGLPVLLLGWWIGPDGQPEAAQVLTMTSTRALHDIAGLHGQNPHQLELTGVGHG